MGTGVLTGEIRRQRRHGADVLELALAAFVDEGGDAAAVLVDDVEVFLVM